MTKAVTLSVPDELKEEMDKYKDQFNWSGIFQKAVNYEIVKYREYQKRLTEETSIEETIARLKREKVETEVSDYELGKQEGLHWAQKAHYSDLKHVYTLIDRDPDLDPIDYGSDKVFGDYITQLIEDRENASIDWYSYFCGWKEVISDFWEEVIKKL